jgi:hypothetical protein
MTERTKTRPPDCSGQHRALGNQGPFAAQIGTRLHQRPGEAPQTWTGLECLLSGSGV